MKKIDKIVISAIRQIGKKVRMRLISYSGENLKSLRKEFKVNQKDLAQALDITQSYVSQLETGLADANKDQLYILGKLFSVKAGYKIVFFVDHNWEDSPDELWGH